MSTMPMPFDWANPNYGLVDQQRARRLMAIRANPHRLPALKLYYRDHIAQWITDFAVTHDPRNVEVGKPAITPFVLFPRQVEFIEFLYARWQAQEPGLVEKSRDVGASWLVMAFACAMCLFHKGITIGIGSRKEELVDRSGDPSSLFFKARTIMQHTPPEFAGGWELGRHSAHMRLQFPETGSAIVGEAGDNIGRGGRSSIFCVDEAAWIERPELVEASLSATTNCRIDISSVCGMDNPFARKRFSGKVPVFTMHYRDDPRKDSAWYRKQVDTLDPVTVAQEIDINYQGSARGLLIPSPWINAAIGAHLKLGIEPTGWKRGGLDCADEGADLNAFAGRHGFLLQHLESWSGKGADLYSTTVKFFSLCEDHGYEFAFYDADGLGSGVRACSRVLNEQREADGRKRIIVEPYRGSASPLDPDGEMIPGRLNRDFFANCKAQSYWALRARFEATYQWIVNGIACDPDTIISIDPALPELTSLVMELAQPTYTLNNVGKVLVNKAPLGSKSPNLGDAVCLTFHSGNIGLQTWMKLGEPE
jgi:phage terminase large subunit